MKKVSKNRCKSNDSKGPRKFYQYVLETIWAGAASVTVGHWVP